MTTTLPTDPSDSAPVLTPRPDLRPAVEDFLFLEADLLDTWQLVAWYRLFALGGEYLVPATDLPDGDGSRDLMLVHDDYLLLEQRVRSMLRRSAHAEFPQSRARHLITNVRVLADERDRVPRPCQLRRVPQPAGRTDRYVGYYAHVLQRDGDGFRFQTRRSVLDHEALSQGKLSIIL